MTQKGTISRKIEETQANIDRLIAERQALSDRLKDETDKSKATRGGQS